MSTYMWMLKPQEETGSLIDSRNWLLGNYLPLKGGKGKNLYRSEILEENQDSLVPQIKEGVADSISCCLEVWINED